MTRDEWMAQKLMRRAERIELWSGVAFVVGIAVLVGVWVA